MPNDKYDIAEEVLPEPVSSCCGAAAILIKSKSGGNFYLCRQCSETCQPVKPEGDP